MAADEFNLLEIIRSFQDHLNQDHQLHQLLKISRIHPYFYCWVCFSNCFLLLFFKQLCLNRAISHDSPFLKMCTICHHKFCRQRKFLNFYCFLKFLSLPIHNFKIHSFWKSSLVFHHLFRANFLFCIMDRQIFKVPCVLLIYYSLCWAQPIIDALYIQDLSNNKTNWNHLVFLYTMDYLFDNLLCEHF